MKTALTLLAITAVLAGCEQRKDKLSFDGVVFRSKASKVDKDPKEMVVSVKPVSASFSGALQAGEYEATRYCVLNFGSSEIDWIVGPHQDEGSYAVENDTLMLRGNCDE